MAEPIVTAHAALIGTKVPEPTWGSSFVLSFLILPLTNRYSSKSACDKSSNMGPLIDPFVAYSPCQTHSNKQEYENTQINSLAPRKFGPSVVLWLIISHEVPVRKDILKVESYESKHSCGGSYAVKARGQNCC